MAKFLTDLAGSSVWFDQGWVTYTAQAKHQQLGVNKDLMAQTAVSPEVAEAMALGALNNSQAQIAIAVTGVAGPGGGDAQRPVGCCWFGFALRNIRFSEKNLNLDNFLHVNSNSLRVHLPPAMSLISVRCNFPGDRHEVRQQAVQFAIDFAAELLISR